MKKNRKKLTLNRETLRDLQEERLVGLVEGGASTLCTTGNTCECTDTCLRPLSNCVCP